MIKASKLFIALGVLGAFAAGLAQTNINDDLFKAIEAKDLQKVKELVANGADVNAKQPNLVGGRRAPLQVALGGLQPEIAAFLIEKGADPNFADPPGSQTHLMKAAQFGYTDVVLMLLKRGAAVNAKDDMLGQTALMSAVQGGHTETAKALLENGADLQMTDDEGQAAIHAAMTLGGHLDTLKMLVAKGANVESRTKSGYTPLMYAVTCAGDEAAFLIESGADVNAVNSGGGTALVIAAKAGAIKSVKLLLAHGADINAKTKSGATALSVAENNDMIILLRQSGAQGDKMPLEAPAALSDEDIKFATEQCQIARTDLDAISKLEKRYRDLLFKRIVRRECNLLAGFKASRAYYAKVKGLKKGDVLPMTPAGWNPDFLTEEEFKVYEKVLDSIW